jgi:hypothetical protein
VSHFDFSQVFATAQDNLTNLENEISSNPHPILTQLEDNYSGYANTISTAFQNSSEGVQKAINGVPGEGDFPGLAKTLETVFADLQQGNTFGAFTEFDPFALDASKAVIRPLTVILGIPAEMAQNNANVLSDLFSGDILYGPNPIAYADTVKPFLNALFAPFISATFAATQDQTLGDFSDLPADVTNAFLNGYTYPGRDEPFSGFLTEGGTLDYFLHTLPEQIANGLNGVDTSDIRLALDKSDIGFNDISVDQQHGIAQALALSPDVDATSGDVTASEVLDALNSAHVSITGDTFNAGDIATALNVADFADGGITTDMASGLSAIFPF